MQVVPAFAKAARSAAVEITTLPGVTVPLQPMGWTTVPQTPERQLGSPCVVGQTAAFAQVVPQELTRLRLTSQPLLVTPSQFWLPGGQGTQPLPSRQV